MEAWDGRAYLVRMIAMLKDPPSNFTELNPLRAAEKRMSMIGLQADGQWAAEHLPPKRSELSFELAFWRWVRKGAPMTRVHGDGA